MQNTWFNKVTAVTSAVVPVYDDTGTTALLHRRNGLAALRISETAVNSDRCIDTLEALAKLHVLGRIETQGKFAVNGLPARLLRARGYSETGPPSVHFKVAVAVASKRIKALEQRFGEHALRTASINTCNIAQIAEVVHNEAMLDDYELMARMKHQGPGAIDATECLVLNDEAGLAGFVVVCHVTDPAERELMIRWVAPRHRAMAMVNFALMLECVNRAAAAGVRSVHFSANPERHSDTMRLACALAAEYCGDSLALVRDLG